MIKIEVCPGNLTPGFDRYSPACLRKLFDGKKVSPVLDFDYDADIIDLIDQINQISVSGVQEKLSAIINNDKITLTPTFLHWHRKRLKLMAKISNIPEVMKMWRHC